MAGKENSDGDVDLSGFPVEGLPDYLDPDRPPSPITVFWTDPEDESAKEPWATPIDIPLQEQPLYKITQLLETLAKQIHNGHLPTHEEVLEATGLALLRASRKNPVLQEFIAQATQYSRPNDPLNHYMRVWSVASGGYEDNLWLPDMEAAKKQIHTGYIDPSLANPPYKPRANCETVYQNIRGNNKELLVATRVGIHPDNGSLLLNLFSRTDSITAEYFFLVEPGKTTNVRDFVAQYGTFPQTETWKYFNENPPSGVGQPWY